MAVAAERWTYKRPEMADYQLSAIFGDERYAVTEATTKSGKTVGCLVWLVEQALAGKPGANYWWVSPIFGQAKVVFRRLKRFLPAWMYTVNETELWVKLPNDTYIWFKSAENADSLYGEDVFAAVLDEASRMKEASFFAVRSTLTATRGPLRIIGNVNGRRNWFWAIARRAESGESDMHYARITAYDAVRAHVLDADEIADAKRLLPEHVFKELYMAEASEDGSNPFGDAFIDACTLAGLADGPADAWGVDLAKSQDWTVKTGLNADGHCCHFERYQRPWEETTQNVLDISEGTAYVDATGVGDPIVERLTRARPDIFMPYVFSAPSKQRLMEGLAVAIQQAEIGYPPGPIVDELRTFTYVYTRTGVRYEALEGLHDDCVMSLGLAVHARAHRKPAVEFW